MPCSDPLLLRVRHDAPSTIPHTRVLSVKWVISASIPCVDFDKINDRRGHRFLLAALGYRFLVGSNFAYSCSCAGASFADRSISRRVVLSGGSKLLLQWV